MVDVFPRTRRTAAPARAAVGTLPDDLVADDLPGDLADLDQWLTREIPARPRDPTTCPPQCFAAVPASEPPAEPAPPRRGRALVRAAVVAVLVSLVAGSATAVAADKTVVVTVDGHDRVVHTFAADVAGALASAGVAVAPQDRVEPALGTDLADGDHVIFARARPLTLVEGSSERRIWTTAASVDEALRGAGVDAEPIQMSTAPGTTIPPGGLAVELRIPRSVTFVDGTGPREPVTTTVGTVGALLAERGVTLGVDDVSVPSGDTPLTDGMAVQVVRNGVGEVVEVRRIPPPEEIVEDPELPRGRREVVEKGRPGEQTVVMRVHVQNGEEVRREQVRAGATTPPRKRVVRLGTNDDLLDRAVAPAVGAGGVGRAGPLRGGRELGDQHRQRLLRRPAVRPADLARVRRRPVRAAAAPGRPGRADRRRVAGARRPRRLRLLACVRPEAGAADVTDRPDRCDRRRTAVCATAACRSRRSRAPAERVGHPDGTIGAWVMRVPRTWRQSQRVPVPVGPRPKRPPTAPRPPTRPSRAL